MTSTPYIALDVGLCISGCATAAASNTDRIIFLTLVCISNHLTARDTGTGIWIKNSLKMYNMLWKPLKNHLLNVAEDKSGGSPHYLDVLPQIPSQNPWYFYDLFFHDNSEIHVLIEWVKTQIRKRKALKYSIFQPNILLLNYMVLKTYHNSEVSFILK